MSLRDPAHRMARLAQLRDPHVAPLSQFVESIRERGNVEVPYFDPLDGGMNAQCLFVLEAPGPKAIQSGFVSRNNPDVSARNWFELNVQAGIERKLTASWNVVPWYLGDHSKIRAAGSSDVRQGLPYLLRLIGMLAQLRVVALVGRAAGRARGEVAATYPSLKLVEVPHPSPTFVNRSPRNRQAVLDGLIRVRSLLE